eukprot:COSAG02_NODE_30387_length_552_cov_0.781457_2_plen_39_part_01
MDKILEILWYYTPRGIPPMASSSLLLDIHIYFLDKSDVR